MACKLFIEKFGKRVIAESLQCHSCQNRRRLCKKFSAEYNHLADDVLSEILIQEYCSASQVRDVLLTFLHNCVDKHVRGEEYSKNDVHAFVSLMEEHGYKLESPSNWHPECCKEALPNYLMVVAKWNQTSVFIYDNVYDYYSNRPNLNPEFYRVFKTLYFDKWLEDLLSPKREQEIY